MIAAVSPHLDDAVLSCGALLAAHPGSLVITVLAGGKASWDTVTPWDASCGFSPGEDVIAARRAEDAEALQRLRARPLWLDFLDAQYGGPPPVDEMTAALEQAISLQRPDMLVVPLGLFHSDHLAVAEASIPLVHAGLARASYAYEDVPYRRTPGLVAAAVGRLAKRGITADPAPFHAPARAHDQKRRAVRCYRSQLRGLSSEGRAGYDDAFRPEGRFRLHT